MKPKRKSAKPTKVKDLAPDPRRARKVRGGAAFADVCKTPAPSGPVAIPYPN